MATTQIKTPLKAGEGLRGGACIILAPAVHDFLTEATDLVDAEVGGVGYVYETKSGDMYVDEVWITPQVVSPASVDFLPEADVLAIEKAIADERIEDLRFSWHSHGDLDVFWSQTDERGVKTRLQREMPYLVSLVVNKRGEMRGRVDAPVADCPWIGQVTLDPVKILRERRSNPLAEQVRQQVKENVKVIHFTSFGKGGKKLKTSGKPASQTAKNIIEAVMSGKTGEDDTPQYLRPPEIPKDHWLKMSPAERQAWHDPDTGINDSKIEDDDVDLASLSQEEFHEWLNQEGYDAGTILLDSGEVVGDDPGITVESLVVNGPDEDIQEREFLPYGLQPHEVEALREAGHDLDSMTDDQITDALIEVTAENRGQV